MQNDPHETTQNQNDPKHQSTQALNDPSRNDPSHEKTNVIKLDTKFPKNV